MLGIKSERLGLVAACGDARDTCPFAALSDLCERAPPRAPVSSCSLFHRRSFPPSFYRPQQLSCLLGITSLRRTSRVHQSLNLKTCCAHAKDRSDGDTKHPGLCNTRNFGVDAARTPVHAHDDCINTAEARRGAAYEGRVSAITPFPSRRRAAEPPRV